ncbi:MAG: hypothetical protein ACTHLT_12595 [Devosia sp.]
MPRLNVKQAIAIAKDFVVDVMADEQPTNVGLEEVRFDDHAGNWLVTIGFSRPWNAESGPLGAWSNPRRDYRMITVSDANGTALAMQLRDEIEANA